METTTLTRQEVISAIIRRIKETRAYGKTYIPVTVRRSGHVADWSIDSEDGKIRYSWTSWGR